MSQALTLPSSNHSCSLRSQIEVARLELGVRIEEGVKEVDGVLGGREVGVDAVLRGHRLITLLDTQRA